MPARERVLDQLKSGKSHLVLKREFKVAARKGFCRLGGQYVLVKWVKTQFVVQENVRPVIAEKMIEQGLLVERDFAVGYKCFELKTKPRYDKLFSEKGAQFKVNDIGARLQMTAIKAMAGEYGYDLEHVSTIKAFKLVPKSDQYQALVNPFIHGVYKSSDLDILGWQLAIEDTLIREGVLDESGRQGCGS